MDSNRYIGPTKVDEIHETDKKSPVGRDLYYVTFENDADRPQYVTEELYEIVSSEEQEDDNYVQKQKFDDLIPELVDLISEYNLKFFELSTLMQKLHEQFQNRLERASNYQWTQNDDYWSPGFNYTNNIQTLDIREVIETIEANNDEEEE